MHSEVTLYHDFVTWLVDARLIHDQSDLLQKELTLKVRDPAKSGEQPFLQDVLSNLIEQMSSADRLHLSSFIVHLYIRSRVAKLAKPSDERPLPPRVPPTDTQKVQATGIDIQRLLCSKLAIKQKHGVVAPTKQKDRSIIDRNIKLAAKKNATDEPESSR